MEQQKIVLYTMFVEFFGKQTKLQKLCCMHLGFGIFRNQMGQQKLVSPTCFFWGVGEKYQLRSLSSSDEGLYLKQRDWE